jgi:hypothetical protein
MKQKDKNPISPKKWGFLFSDISKIVRPGLSGILDSYD